MRKVAASLALGKGASAPDVFRSSDCSSLNGFSTGSAVGNTLIGSDGCGSGVACITFEQHSMLVRYPNSMSNLRRLRCYLLACQVRTQPYVQPAPPALLPARLPGAHAALLLCCLDEPNM